MNEPEVVEKLAEYLIRNEYTFFIDSGAYGDLPSKLAGRSENCGENTAIRIGRRIPDVIGFTPSDDIFAIEAKGEDDLRKGIGQAAHYRQGVHKSYIAATASSLNEFEDTALSCGLGIFPINTSGVDRSRIEHPVENIGATKLNRTRRALSVRTSRFEPDSVSIPSTTRPENALLPVISIKQESGPLSDEEMNDIYRESPQDLSIAMHSLALAQTLDLVNKVDNKYHLTDIGNMSYLLLTGLIDNPPSIKYLDFDQSDDTHEKMFKLVGAIKKSGQYKNTKLYEHSTELATFLRNQYMNIADVRLLCYILARYKDDNIELSEAMALVALESPDAFLGLFCSSGKEYEFRKLVEESDTSIEDPEFQDSLLNMAGSNSLYNFLYQIWNVGILSEGTDPVHQDAELVRGEFYWEWNADVIGKLGSTI